MTKTKTSTTIKLTSILTLTVLVGVIFLLGPGIPINAEAVSVTEFLACRPTGTPVGFFPNPGAPTCNLISGIALNDLVGAPPIGTLAVLEPDTVQHTSTWESAPLTAPLTLLPGSVTLDLVMMNHAENDFSSNDICWSKHIILPDGNEIDIVAPHCFENPLPETPGVCSFGATPPSAACIALAALVSETVPSLIAAPTVIPAGSVIELSVFCPGSSFIGVFFNNGIDVDGDGVLEFSKLTEEQADIVEIDIKPGSDPNSINTKSKGLVPVAILGSDTFDVLDVDVTTLAFGPDGATPVHNGHLEDVNDDGFTDLVTHYKQKETGLASGDTEACITGLLLDATPIDACDSVKIVK